MQRGRCSTKVMMVILFGGGRQTVESTSVEGRRLNAHVRKVHAGIRKKCPHCPKDFAVGDLRNHIKAGHSAASKG